MNFLIILAVTVACVHAQGSCFDPNYNSGLNFEVQGESLPKSPAQVGSLQDPFMVDENGYQVQGLPSPAPGPVFVSDEQVLKLPEWIQPAPEA